MTKCSTKNNCRKKWFNHTNMYVIILNFFVKQIIKNTFILLKCLIIKRLKKENKPWTSRWLSQCTCCRLVLPRKTPNYYYLRLPPCSLHSPSCSPNISQNSHPDSPLLSSMMAVTCSFWIEYTIKIIRKCIFKEYMFF